MKKLLIVFMSIVMILSLGIIINASDTGEELKIIDKKIKEAEELANQPQPRATMINIGGAYIVYQQEQSNYCVPACIKSTLQFINGDSPSQS